MSAEAVELDLREQIARIDRMRDESDKFRAEQRKLIAESLKLAEEEARLHRDRVLSPWLLWRVASAA